MVFKAWLEKKKGQMQEERRIQRAKELEGLNSRVSRYCLRLLCVKVLGKGWGAAQPLTSRW